MNVICHIKPELTVVRGNAGQLWVRVIADSYSEDCLVDIPDISVSEVTQQAAIRTAVSGRMSAVAKTLVLATDIRLI